MADEQFRGEDTIDEEGLNATQRRVREEGSVWKDVGPADTGDGVAGQDEGDPSLADVDPKL
ncbi:MAG: hypothetical protein M3M94_04780 [Actinomycetota bacterium]|nr:hypothetical protein [Actinomycetota bacterium]